MTGVQVEREYLRAAEAATFLNVSPKTVSRWAKEGKVPHIVTLGGHRRFPRREIEALARRLGARDYAYAEVRAAEL
jgi:excisionase family DNA binding protein